MLCFRGVTTAQRGKEELQLKSVAPVVPKFILALERQAVQSSSYTHYYFLHEQSDQCVPLSYSRPGGKDDMRSIYPSPRHLATWNLPS
jgi:hypothetical protein